jgi:hypothetical protein
MRRGRAFWEPEPSDAEGFMRRFEQCGESFAVEDAATPSTRPYSTPGALTPFCLMS